VTGPTADLPPRAGLLFAIVGVALVLAGVVGDFVAVIEFGAWLPRVRNDAVPSLIAVALGLVLSLFAVIRARRSVLAGVLLAVSVLFAGWFGGMLYVFSALPPVAGPAIGAAAPDFAAPDQAGKTVRLADFRGHPLLLVFYRGHW
jgi:hypothetical protein